MPSHKPVITVQGFKGINNRLTPEREPPGYLRTADNINIDSSGSAAKRQGYTLKDHGHYTSIWASDNGLGCYAVKDGDLVSISPDYVVTTLLSGYLIDKVSFEEVDGVIYLISDEFSGRIVRGELKGFGVTQQTSQPTLSISTGLLPEGDYQVVISSLRDDGVESGTSKPQIIRVPTNSKISFTLPTITSPSIIAYKIYCSNPSGSELFYHGTSSSGSYDIDSPPNSIIPFKMFNLYSPPLGSIIKYFKGRLYIASGNILWYSEPFQYEHFRLDSNYFEYPEPIREVMPVESGIWVASDKVYYLQGSNPDEFKQITKELAKIVPGTSTMVSNTFLNIDNTPYGYKWLVSSDIGILALFDQGFFTNMTSANLSLESASSGTSTFVQLDGLAQYLSILKKDENPNNSTMGDLVEATIIRNGVPITFN